MKKIGFGFNLEILVVCLLAGTLSLSMGVGADEVKASSPLPLTQFTLTASVSPEGAGTVTPSGTTFQSADEAVPISATANPGYRFSHWSGDLSGAANPTSISMTKPKSVTAVFEPLETVSAPATPSGPTRGLTDITYTYTTSGATSNLGHPIQYRFELGDGIFTGWSSSGRLDLYWPFSGTYSIRAYARCAIEHSVVSSPSAALVVRIEPPSTYPTIGLLESPADGQTCSGINTIYGWALDLKGITKAELYIDNQFVTDIPYGSLRGDVKAVYPDYPKAENSGFAAVWNYSILPEGKHVIMVRIHNQDGLVQDLKASVNVKKFHGEYVQDLTPAADWLYNKSVTAEGVTKYYDIKIEWFGEIQGFQIVDIVPK